MASPGARIAVLLTVMVVAVECKIYDRCELARELRDVHEIPLGQIPTWVCIARHESEYNTSARNPGSGDHGLLQISEIFWCSPPGYACGVSCDDLRNEDIEDDVICARRIYREHQRLSGDGFNAWVVYSQYCRDKAYVKKFIEGCFNGVKDVKVQTTHDLPSPVYFPKFTTTAKTFTAIPFTTTPFSTIPYQSTPIETTSYKVPKFRDSKFFEVHKEHVKHVPRIYSDKHKTSRIYSDKNYSFSISRTGFRLFKN